ncbi:long-chain fatty acid--CoA ligase [Candidatus Auribacterota bacterium]
MTLVQLLDRSSENRGNKRAVSFGKNTLTYSELAEYAERVAAALRSSFGIQKGDRVCLLMSNCVEYPPCLFGIIKSGAWAIPVNTFLAPEEIRFILEDSRAKVVITGEDLLEKVLTATASMKTKPEIICSDGAERKDTRLLSSILTEDRFSMRDIEPDDTALIIYTSGTTGTPKGAMLSHRNFVSNINDCVKVLRANRHDRFILFLPLFHSFTLTVCLLLPLSIGASIYILRSVKPFDKVIKTILFKRITGFIAIPQIYHLLGEKKIPWWMRKLIAIRFCISGSAPLSEEVLKKFERNTGLPLMEGYGLTETSPVVSVNPLYGERKVSSVGPPIESVKVRIVDDAGSEVPPGDSGEICVKGPNVMKGYFEKPEETAGTITNGWLHTGDIGKLDEDGYIYILDRKKDMILSRGLNIYPREIEQVLYQHPAIKDAAVIGMADRNRGETPLAFVTLKEGAAAAPKDLIKFCRDKLALYKTPHKIYIVNDLPRNPTGKILKKEIKKNLELAAK